MENKIFMNGINLVRSVLSQMNNLEGVGMMGYSSVMENVVEAGLTILNDKASVVMIDGAPVDLLDDCLDDEAFIVPLFKSHEVVMRLREVNRLSDEYLESSGKYAQRFEKTLVSPEKSFAESRGFQIHIVVNGLNGDFGEECTVAAKLIELYDEWESEELGEFGVLLHRMLKIAREAADCLVDRLEESEDLTDEEFEMQMRAMGLRDDATDRILMMREDHLDWMDFPCNGDCANCEHFTMGEDCEDDEEDEEE